MTYLLEDRTDRETPSPAKIRKVCSRLFTTLTLPYGTIATKDTHSSPNIRGIEETMRKTSELMQPHKEAEGSEVYLSECSRESHPLNPHITTTTLEQVGEYVKSEYERRIREHNHRMSSCISKLTKYINSYPDQ